MERFNDNTIDFKEKAKLAKGSNLYRALDSIASSYMDDDGYIVMDSKAIKDLQSTMAQDQRERLLHDGYSTYTTIRSNAEKRMRLSLSRVADSANGYPTQFMADSGLYKGLQNIYFSPDEASMLYSSNGLPTHIIDKKASGVFLNGLNFRCKGISQDLMAEFTEYAESSGFIDQWRSALTQALVYGGAIMYPIMKYDNPSSLLESIDIYDKDSVSDFLEYTGNPKKSFLKEFSVFDRWNTVIVPEYSPMAKDYLMAGAMFIPVDGVTVNTSRASLIKWKKTSYWEALRFIGWCPSDFSGWMDSYMQYKLMQQALPKMAMQSSLLYSYLPIDPVLMQNGTSDVRELQSMAQEALDNISVNNAKVFNSVGELKSIERQYSGFKDIFAENRVSLCADIGLPVSVVFEDAPKGLASDRADDIILKKAEAVKMIWNNISHEVARMAILLGYDFFGVDSKEAENLKYLIVESTSHTAETAQQKADIANTFADTVSKLSVAGVAPRDGIKLVEKFFPEIPMSESMEESLSRSFSMLQNAQNLPENARLGDKSVIDETTDSLDNLDNLVKWED